MDWFGATAGPGYLPLYWVTTDRLCKVCIWKIHQYWPQVFDGLLKIRGVMVYGVSGG